MENYTSNFYILTFTTDAENKPLLVFLFFFIYLIGVLANLTTILVIYTDQHLHTPMYLFLCNLSFIDICYTTTTIPKLVHMLLSGNYLVTVTQCFTQLYCFILFASTEELLLSTMAYDRYVAICNPLRYHCLLSKKCCILFMVAIWVSGCLNSAFITFIASHNLLCYSNRIPQFYCDFKAFSKISCPDTGLQLSTYAEVLLFGLCPLICSLTSYVKVIMVIWRIKSRDGRRKAFSTCLSHLMVLTIFYGTGMPVYLMPPSEHPYVAEQAFTVLYATVTPMLNPLIYSVRNKDVKRTLVKMVNGGCEVREAQSHY